jgi:hypothetical protein
MSEPLARIIRLPDGRWAIENGEGVGDLTLDDIEQVHAAFMAWASALWRARRQRLEEQ